MIQSFIRRVTSRVRVASTLLRAMVYKRKLGSVTFVGIAGSVGKTTVKNLTAAILSTDGPCNSTLNSRNNLFFVAETIINTKQTDKYGVIEIHGGSPGVMDTPIRLVRPDIGVLTNIGHDHFKSFTNKNEIAKEKRKIVDQLPVNGIAVLNRDDAQVRQIGESCNRHIIWIGKDNGSTIQLIESRSDYPEPLTIKARFNDKVYTINTRLHGNHLASAVLLSVGVAIAAKLSIDSAIRAVAEVLPEEGRMQLVTTRAGVTFIRDDFKAPYWSVKEPIEFLSNAKALRKVAIFGTVSDYSRSASDVYRQLAGYALPKADLVVFIGPHALRTLKAKKHESDDRLRAFPDIRDAADFLQNELRKGDLVLLKGSNKVDHLERLILSSEHEVTCWIDNCRLMMFC